jgi:hypothetical protein
MRRLRHAIYLSQRFFSFWIRAHRIDKSFKFYLNKNVCQQTEILQDCQMLYINFTLCTFLGDHPS